jgi:hypothetical protein
VPPAADSKLAPAFSQKMLARTGSLADNAGGDRAALLPR